MTWGPSLGSRVAGTVGMVAAVLVVLVVVLGGDSPGRAQPDAEAERVFSAECADCHGDQGQGALEGPSLQGLPAGVDSTAPGVAEIVRDGLGDMDAFGGELTDVEIDAVATYVVDRFATEPDVPRGGESFRLNCAGCHGAAGTGGALIYSEVNAPGLLDVSAAHDVSAIRTGPGTMPAFNRAALSDAEVASIAAYVEALQSPPTDGGLQIAYPGPVSEGLIAVAVGLGAAVLAAVWVERGGRG